VIVAVTGWGGHVTVLYDGQPSAVTRVMGQLSGARIYSNRLTQGPLELLEVKGCLHILSDLSSCNPVY